MFSRLQCPGHRSSLVNSGTEGAKASAELVRDFIKRTSIFKIESLNVAVLQNVLTVDIQHLTKMSNVKVLFYKCVQSLDSH